MTGLTLIAVSFLLNAMKPPLRRRAIPNRDENIGAVLVALPWALLNMIVCAGTLVSFWAGVLLLVWSVCQ